MARRFPARLHVLLASKAPAGVVIRRGPSKCVCSIFWNRETDEFELGQWLRGRIYERRSDVSPDGRYLIYFAMNGRWSSPARGSWTAISRAPWLKAIALFGKGDCWNGGGMFTSNSRYWLNDGCGHFLMQDSREVRWDSDFRPIGHYGGECPSVYYVRLQRDDWMLKERLTAGRTEAIAIFEKELPRAWILRKYAHEEAGAPPGKGCYWDEHELENPATGQRLMFPKWEWADSDRKKLVWAEDGCLYRAALSARELGQPEMVHDFNDMQFERRVAPY